VDREILEIGCGEHSRLSGLSGSANSLTCIDPDSELIQKARSSAHPPNLRYLEGRAENLDWPAEKFDVVVFTLSFHHVPVALMDTAITEAVRVTRQDGLVIFLEPLAGSMFSKSMRRFNFCDGDERSELAMAYYCMLNAQTLVEIAEFRERVIIEFDSFSDFTARFPVRSGIEEDLKDYLELNDYRLIDDCRMNVFSKSTYSLK